MVKAIALYLPQFHRVPENDEWWGEGYTEWTAVKQADKLFPEHYQPHVPLHKNYYNLLDKETMVWQVQLMKEYNVYGMCFYHYYFQNGRKILEKPAENLLKWTDINMPFCFSWANPSWVRSWSKLCHRGGVWNSKIEKKQNLNDDGILLMQEYGEEREWEKHFYYLLPFFQDKRYIKINNKPIFIIYAPNDAVCLPAMIDTWNALAYKNGMEGIYFIGTNEKCSYIDSFLRQKVYYSETLVKNRADYKETCDKIVQSALQLGDDAYLCGFTGYDDTPRRGENGIIIENSTPNKFYNLMKTLCYLSEKRGKEFVFVNAWNEWGEGMHLEPDEKYGYAYLEALKKALDDYKDFKEDDLDMERIECTESEQSISIRRNAAMVKALDQWLRIKEDNKSLVSYFEKNGYKNIAIYGIGILGRHLITELEQDDNINIVYGIDRRKKESEYKFPIVWLDQELPKVDLIVVTVIHDYEPVSKDIHSQYSGKIVSLKEIIDWVITYE